MGLFVLKMLYEVMPQKVPDIFEATANDDHKEASEHLAELTAPEPISQLFTFYIYLSKGCRTQP
jgi:hypothetical protein